MIRVFLKVTLYLMLDKSQFVHYVTRVDLLSVKEIQLEDVFLKKIAGKFGDGQPASISNLNDEEEFKQENIMHRLRQF